MSKYKKPESLSRKTNQKHHITSPHEAPGTPLDQPPKIETCGGGFILSTSPTKHREDVVIRTTATDLQDEERTEFDSPPSTPWRRLSLEALAPSTPSPKSLGDLDLNDTEQGSLIDYYKQGTKLYTEKKYAEAIVQFDQALRIDNRYANAHYNKALALKAMEKYDESMAEHEKALELKPHNILYLCSKGRLHLHAHEHTAALKCFEDAHQASTNSAQPSFSEKNQDFIQQMLLERSKLLEHIANLQKASIANQEIIDAYANLPAFRTAVEHFKDLKTQKAELIEKCMHDLHSAAHQTSLDFGAPPEEMVSQLQTTTKQHGHHSSPTRQLYKTIQTLSRQLALLEQNFLHQQKELSKLSAEQELLQDKTEEQDIMLEQQAEDIQKLEQLAASLETNQQGIRALIQALEAQGAHNTEKLLEEIADLKHNLASILPTDLDLNEYQTGFFQTLRQDLIAAQSAASLVTRSDIIRNSKTGTAGRVGDFLDVAGDVIPELGGFIQFFAAIISTADHHRQQQLVTKLADIATTPIEMERIAYSVARILSDPKYFDRALVESGPQSLKTKIVNYLFSFIEELADGSQTSSTHSAAAETNQHETHTPSKKHFSLFRKTKSFSEGASTNGRAEEPEEHSHRKFFLFPRKSKTGPIDEESRKTESEASTSTRSIDFLQKSRDLSEERSHTDDSRSNLHSKKSFSFFRKHTKSSSDESNESIDSALATEEERGANNAHLISSIIISAIYKGQVQARSFHTHTDDIIQKILEVVFVKLDLSTEQIPNIVSRELTHEPEVSVRAETEHSSPLNKKLEAKKMAAEVLDEVKTQVEIEIPEKFDRSALHAISSRIETEYSSNQKPIIESMMESSAFKIAFIDRLIATLVEQINDTGNPKITLTSARKAIKATEQALSDEGDNFRIDADPTELLVWHLDEAFQNAITGDSTEHFSLE